MKFHLDPFEANYMSFKSNENLSKQLEYWNCMGVEGYSNMVYVIHQLYQIISASNQT